MTTQQTAAAFYAKDAESPTYDAPRPTQEQLNAVLPWLVDKTITWAQKHRHCDTVSHALGTIIDPDGQWDRNSFYSAAGYDCYGMDRQGFNAEGYDKNGRDKDGRDSEGYDRYGFNADGFDYRGRDKDGFNAQGFDRNGKTRADAIAELVGGWSPAHLQAMAAKLAERQAAVDAKAAEAAAKEAETTDADTEAEELVAV